MRITTHSAGIRAGRAGDPWADLVETEYRSSWWTHSTPATMIRFTSSFLIPMLEPLMVTEMRPFRGP